MSNPRSELAHAIREAISRVESAEHYAAESHAEGFGDLLLIKHELQMLANEAEIG
jgi:hypothetical protein